MNNIGYLLSKASVSLKLALSNRLLPYNLTSTQWAVLKDISMHQQGTTPAQIADRIGAERPTITGILDRMKKKELITSHPHQTDKRSTLILLSAKGESLVEELETIANAMLKDALHGISTEDQASLASTLQKIIVNTADREKLV